MTNDPKPSPDNPLPFASVHTSRTMMFAELSKLMDFSSGADTNFELLLNENIIAKQTQANKNKTTKYLKSLYLFSEKDPAFKMFHYLWGLIPVQQKPLLAFLIAITRDTLLAESIDTVMNITPVNRVSIQLLEECVESKHPKKYSEKTLLSIAQNIASSWKQSGHITGKVKNIRTQVNPSYYHVTYALFLGYISGLRGEFLFNTKWTKALDCSDNELRILAQEAAIRDLITFQFAGNIVILNFKSLIHKLNIYGIED